MGCENKVSELKSELKLKIFELERAQILNEEIIKNNQRSIIENEKLQKKIEVISFVKYFICWIIYIFLFWFKQLIQKEYYTLQLQNDKRFMEIENDLNEKKSRLESYEKVENEMDLVIRQVAESSKLNWFFLTIWLSVIFQLN